MPHIIFHIDWQALPAALQEAVQPGVMLERIGRRLAQHIRSRFDSQTVGSTPLPERMVPNIPGILRYFERGGSWIPSRYFEPRPVLVDSGNLRGSITYQVSGTTLEVGTNVDYAQKQFEGGMDILPGGGRQGDPNIRRGLTTYFKARPESRKQLGWLLSRDLVEVNIQPRNVLEVTADVEELIESEMTHYLTQRIFGGSLGG